MSTSLLDCKDETDNFRYEKSLRRCGITQIGGCDEVGRGPLAGPVVAACVVLPSDCTHHLFLDSKVLSHKKRVYLNEYLHEIQAGIGLGIVNAQEIDRLNILQASLLAMKKAVQQLSPVPNYLLVDGKFNVPITIDQETLIKGESKSASIAAASIVAKVYRDTMMIEMDQRWPEYKFKSNKGYPTKAHRQALKEYGPCPIHRKTFKGVLDRVK